MKHFCIAFLLALISHIGVFGQQFTVDGIKYNVTSTNPATVEVAREQSTNLSGAITIPDSVTNASNTYAVTGIGASAFFDCNGITSLIIPNSVRTIGSYAFSGCSSVTSIIIPAAVNSIADHTFYNCTSLKAVNIPNSVLVIGTSAFTNCRSLTGIDIPTSVIEIGESAFGSNLRLASVSIPNSVREIGSHAFDNCWGLTSLKIGTSVKIIGFRAFSFCKSLTSVNIPNSVTNLGDYAFANCNSMSSVTVNWKSPLHVNTNVFENVNVSKIYLNVPEGTQNDYRTAFFWKDFNMNVVSGVDEGGIDENQLSVYPNPTSAFCTIEADDNVGSAFSYSIVDVTGRTVSTGKSLFGNAISIESLSAGYYVIHLTTEEGKHFCKKLVAFK